MKKVLHLSHHYGCLKDHQYVCNSLGLNLTSCFSLWNTVIPQGCFSMTESLANNIWEKNKEYFKTFDYIITSDTTPLSRIILQNLEEFNGKLNIWVCNRFDYAVNGDHSYYNLFKYASKHDRVKIIPYTEFERFYLNNFDIQTNQETIRPIGLNIETSLSDNEISEIGYDDNETIDLNLSGEVLISRYHNDNIFQNSKEICESFDLVCKHAKYRGFNELKILKNNYNCFLIFPEQYSKLIAFELMQLGMPVILPSRELLLKCSNKPNYFFGSGINHQTIEYCEWYNEYFQRFAVYFEDISSIKESVNFVKENKTIISSIMKECSEEHIKKTLNQWSKVYNV